MSWFSPPLVNHKSAIAAHPSRRPLRGLLRMRLNFLKHHNPHAEERASRASRSVGSSTDVAQPVLLSCRFGATGTRVGGAKQSVWRHQDRIGRGLAERLDHLV